MGSKYYVCSSWRIKSFKTKGTKGKERGDRVSGFHICKAAQTGHLSLIPFSLEDGGHKSGHKLPILLPSTTSPWPPAISHTFTNNTGHFFLGLASVHNDEVRSPLTKNVASCPIWGKKVTISRKPWTGTVTQNQKYSKCYWDIQKPNISFQPGKMLQLWSKVHFFVCSPQCNSNKRRWAHQNNLSQCPGSISSTE